LSSDKENSRSIEEEVFKTLGHQIRRDILRFVGESKNAKFTEIKMAIGIEESASLSYHISALSPLLLHSDDLYSLSILGKDAYSLMTKVATYSASSEIISGVSKQIRSTIIANALMWASAFASLIVLEGPLEFMTMSIFAALFSVSNLILYSILQYTQPK